MPTPIERLTGGRSPRSALGIGASPLSLINRPLATGFGRPSEMSPEQEASLTSSLASGAVSGLGSLGNILDLPGSTVRDIVGGENPIDQWAPWNWTSSEHRLGERELARRLGLAGSEDTWANWSGSLALGMALDPLTYIGIGAATRAGKLAAKAGVSGAKTIQAATTKVASEGSEAVAKRFGKKVGAQVGKREAHATMTIEDLLQYGAPSTKSALKRTLEATYGSVDDGLREVGGEVLRSGVSLDVPFMGSLGYKVPGKIASGYNRAADAVGGLISNSPVGIAGRGLFEAASEGFFNPAKQKLARLRYGNARAAQMHAMKEILSFRDEMADYTDIFAKETGLDEITGTGGDLNVGDVVLASDRKNKAPNYGRVSSVDQHGADVFFQNPDTGATKTVPFLHSDGVLEVAFRKGSAQADDYRNAQHMMTASEVVRFTAENGSFEKALERAFGPNASASPALRDKTIEIARMMQDSLRSAMKAYEQSGGNVRYIEALHYEYAPRGVNPKQAEKLGFEFSARVRNQRSREEAIRTIPAGVVNDIVIDTKLRTAIRAGKGGEYVATHYTEHLDDAFHEVAEAMHYADDAGTPLTGKDAHAASIADWVDGRKKKAIFTRSIVEDFFDYHRSLARATANLEAIQDTVLDPTNHLLADEGVPLAKVFSQAGLRTEDFVELSAGAHADLVRLTRNDSIPTHVRSVEELVQSTNLSEEAIRDLIGDELTRVADRPPTALEALAERSGKSVEELSEVQVHPDVAKAINASRRVEADPEWLQSIGKAIDSIHSYWKSGVTVVFGTPAFQSRNLVSGQHMNMAMGLMENLSDLRLYAGYVKHSWDMMVEAKKKGVKALGDADQELLREVEAYDLLGHSMETDITGQVRRGVVPEKVTDMKQTIFDQRQRIAHTPVTFLPEGGRSAKALDTARLIANVAGQTGGKINQGVEWINRVPMYMYLKKKGWDPVAAAMKVEELQFDYSRLAPFERRVMKRLVPFYCVPDDCEILTREGWKKADALTIGEDVLTMDHSTGESEWAPCEDKAIFDYNGVLMNMVNKRDHYTFTPDHRWPINRDTGTRAERHGEIRNIVRGYELRGGYRVPRTSEFTGTESICTPREAAIIGWIVGDGYMRTRKRSPNHTEYLIYQSPKKFLRDIIELVGEDGSVGNPHPDSGVVPIRIVGKFRKRIQELIRTKDEFPALVGRMSRESAEACYQAMMDAEGCGCGAYAKTDRESNFFAQLPGPILDGFQMICQLTGRVAHISSRGAYVSHTFKTIKSFKLGHEHYAGRVWCPQTKHGTWMMRRNGRVIWTGNTFTRRAAPLLYKRILEKPGGALGQSVRGYNYGANEAQKRQQAPLPNYMKDIFAASIGDSPGEEGGQRYITGGGLAIEDATGFLGGPRNAMYEAASRTSPLFKAPLEWMTGQSFFQRTPFGGRPIKSMDPPLGRAIANIGEVTGMRDKDKGPVRLPSWLEYGISQSPVSRGVTRTRTAFDPRKLPSGLGGEGKPVDLFYNALNQMTGFRVTDVSPEAQRRATREAAMQRMQDMGASTLTRPYLREDHADRMSPEERKDFDLMLDLIQLQLRRSKEERD
ncbi:hypothetical protein CMI37_26470 [Candidatus Pacearchaeota archaeon]|nr:hypothetical protein [Candidatus Pacearchaeota archaeon]